LFLAAKTTRAGPCRQKFLLLATGLKPISSLLLATGLKPISSRKKCFRFSAGKIVFPTKNRLKVNRVADDGEWRVAAWGLRWGCFGALHWPRARNK